MSQNTMDRRHFLRALGTAGAAAAISTAGAGIAFGDEAASNARALGDADVNFSQEVDVLIAGAGISGMMAALDPATAGLKTLIVEQNGFFGGDAIYSAACMMCNTAKLTEEERPEKYSTIEQLRERFAPYYENDEAGLDKLMQLQEWGGKFMDKLHYEWGYNFQPKMEGPYQQAFFPEGGICTLPGASEGYKYIFTLKPEGLLNPQVWVFAFGQAFFSLSVAGNGSVIYGSYLPKDEDLPSSARNVALFDTIAALLAAIVIIPAMAVILGDGIVGMKGGPGLMFVYLVNVFNAMPGGRIVGMIFYICVLFAGVSSIVNLYEAPVAFLQEKLHTNRVLSVVIIGVVGGVIALCIQPWTSQWMDVVSIYICPLGALLAGIMFFWVMKKDTALAAVHEGRTVGKKDISGWFYPLGKWVYCAASLAALILGAIYGGIG